MAAVSSDDWLLHRRTATCIFVPGGIGRQRRASDRRRWARMNCSFIFRANPDIQFIIFHTTVGSLLVETTRNRFGICSFGCYDRLFRAIKSTKVSSSIPVSIETYKKVLSE
ncbi:unnamed protein product [Musa acuminata subsp. burmannicoides]